MNPFEFGQKKNFDSQDKSEVNRYNKATPGNLDINEEEKNTKLLNLENIRYYAIKNCLFFQLFCLLLAIIFLIFSYKYLDSIDSFEYEYFLQISKNWRLAPITDVSLGENCKDDGFFKEIWPGLEEGCKCQTQINKNVCSKSSKRKGCVKVLPIPEIEINNWEGKNFCAKHLKFVENTGNLTYFDLEIYKNTNSRFIDVCPSGMKNCGIIDSFRNYLCIQNDHICPINNIVVDNKALSKTFYFNNPEDISIVSKKTINITLSLKNSEMNVGNFFNPLTAEIPIQFKISNEKPCKNPFYKNATFDLYKLDFFYGRQKCFQFADYINIQEKIYSFNITESKPLFEESYYKILDSYDNTALFEENKIISLFSQVPDEFSKQINRNINLYARSYIGMNADCHKKIKDEKIFNKIFNSFENTVFVNDTNGIFTAIFIFSILILMFVFVFSIFSLCYSDKSKLNTMIEVFGILQVIMMLILSLILITALILSIVSTVFLGKIESFDDIFNNKDCIDDFTYEMYTKNYGIISNLKVYSIICLIISLILILSYSLFSFIACRKCNESDEMENKLREERVLVNI